MPTNPIPVFFAFIIGDAGYGILFLLTTLFAKFKFKQNHFEIIEEGNYVNCAVSEKKILLKDLTRSAKSL